MKHPAFKCMLFPHISFKHHPNILLGVKLGTMLFNSYNIYISCVFEHDTYCHLHTHEASSCIPKSKIFRCIVWVLITKEGGSSAPTHWHSDAIRSSEHKLKYFIRREWWAAICNGEWNVITNNISTRHAGGSSQKTNLTQFSFLILTLRHSIVTNWYAYLYDATISFIDIYLQRIGAANCEPSR